MIDVQTDAPLSPIHARTGLDGVWETLRQLHLVPGVEPVMDALRDSELDRADAVQQAVPLLRAVHVRLLAEACPDFWLSEITPSHLNDPDSRDLVGEAAALRLQEAALVSDAIATLSAMASVDSLAPQTQPALASS